MINHPFQLKYTAYITQQTDHQKFINKFCVYRKQISAYTRTSKADHTISAKTVSDNSRVRFLKWIIERGLELPSDCDNNNTFIRLVHR